LRAKTNVLSKLSPLLLSLLFAEILLLAFADADTIHPVFYKSKDLETVETALNV
jgi:hypothetical protein